MTVYTLKNNSAYITIISDIKEKECINLKSEHFRPVYSFDNYYWSSNGTWTDILTFIGLDTTSIDYAYPNGYTDQRTEKDMNELGNPFWDYRQEKTNGYGLPLYKSEILEALSALIRYMIKNTMYQFTYKVNEKGLLEKSE